MSAPRVKRPARAPGRFPARRWPSRLRRWVAGAVLVVALGGFALGSLGWAEPLRAGLFRAQILPALLSWGTLGAAGLAALAAVLLTTLLLGRVYCSLVCPLGLLQDLLGRIRARRRARPRPLPPLGWVRTGFLALALAAALLGSGVVLGWLDPYSLFGKIAGSLLHPPALTAREVGVWLSSAPGWPPPLPWARLTPTPWSLAAAVLALSVLMLLVIRQGRLFCNSVCPVGTGLGWLARFSVLRLAIDEQACHGCGRCERQCKAGCIDSAQRTVDFSRCVGCFNCLDACHDGGIGYEWRWSRRRGAAGPDPLESNGPGKPPLGPRAEPADPGRRAFLAGLMGAAAPALPVTEAPVGPDLPPPRPVLPPGAERADDFHARCTSCQICLSACPTGVLRPALAEYGWSGVFQPRMDFHRSFCNYDCRRCLEVCPTGALQPLTLEVKRRRQLGVARFAKDLCIVEIKGTDCGACAEHCPTHAVTMQPYRGHLLLPVVEDERCIGCGFCEYACPTRPRAIVVEGLDEHRQALPPAPARAPALPPADAEFPF